MVSTRSSRRRPRKEEHSELDVAGIKVAVVRKRIKNVYLRVNKDDDVVRVSAPYSTTDAFIRSFVESRMDWISAQRKKIQEHPTIHHRYLDGETLYLWGIPYTLAIKVDLSDAHKPKIDHDDVDEDTEGTGGTRPVALHVSSKDVQQTDEAYDRRKQAVEAWYRDELIAAVPHALARAEDVVGEKASEWRVRNMTTRWGSCNIAHRRIWLSIHLAKRPPECLDGVIVHELVHLLVRNHDAKFYAYMDHFYPNWRAVKKTLNSSMYD